MHGKIFGYEHLAKDASAGDDSAHVVNIFASFGGLLMSLKGQQRTLAQLEKDKLIYVLISKIRDDL